MTCPYTTLGVSRDAPKTTIKRAYHRLALEYHPDKNPNDPIAEAKFRELSRAYAILSDDAKRKHYDRTGSSEPGWGPGQNFAQDVGEMFEGIFGEVFGRQRRRSTQTPSVDINVSLAFTFSEMVAGSSRNVEVKKQGRCRRCSGTGSQPGSSPHICTTCQGAGERRMTQGLFGLRKKCPACFGRGRLIPHPCQSCEGEGISLQNATVKVTCPIGAASGSIVRLAGEGHERTDKTQRGDLIITLEIGSHPRLTRDGANLGLALPVTAIEAMLGGQVEVRALGNPIRMRLPPGTQAGRTFRLRAKGLPQPEGYPAGDLLVTVDIEIPENLDAATRASLEHLKDLSLTQHFPRVGRARAQSAQALDSSLF